MNLFVECILTQCLIATVCCLTVIIMTNLCHFIYGDSRERKMILKAVWVSMLLCLLVGTVIGTIEALVLRSCR